VLFIDCPIRHCRRTQVRFSFVFLHSSHSFTAQHTPGQYWLDGIITRHSYYAVITYSSGRCRPIKRSIRHTDVTPAHPRCSYDVIAVKWGKCRLSNFRLISEDGWSASEEVVGCNCATTENGRICNILTLIIYGRKSRWMCTLQHTPLRFQATDAVRTSLRSFRTQILSLAGNFTPSQLTPFIQRDRMSITGGHDTHGGARQFVSRRWNLG